LVFVLVIVQLLIESNGLKPMLPIGCCGNRRLNSKTYKEIGIEWIRTTGDPDPEFLHQMGSFLSLRWDLLKQSFPYSGTLEVSSPATPSDLLRKV
jgi:hypothetical protein